MSRKYKTFKCDRDKCLTCPLTTCIYDQGKLQIVEESGFLVKVFKSTQSELVKDEIIFDVNLLTHEYTPREVEEQ